MAKGKAQAFGSAASSIISKTEYHLMSEEKGLRSTDYNLESKKRKGDNHSSLGWLATCGVWKREEKSVA